MLDWDRVFRWIRNLRAKTLPPLAGAPPVRRHKTYSARSGYVYQYVYEGYRAAQRGPEPGTQFIFQVSWDRKTFLPVSVLLGAAALESWEGTRGRRLNSTERYAIAKMALFQAFDEREKPQQMRQEVLVRAADVAAILETLGID